MGMQVSIGIDLGASGGKMGIGRFDGAKLTVSDFIDFQNRAVALNGSLYWDVFGLYHSIIDGCSAYAASNKEIRSIAVDAWGASYGLLDKWGRLLEPVFHYRDQRTEHSVEEMYKVLDKKRLFELTGCQCNRTYTLPQLFSYQEHGSDMLEKAKTMLFLPDLLEYFLSGEISTEMTIAGTSALMNTAQEDWSRKVFEYFKLPQKMLTSIVDAGTLKGKLSAAVSQQTGLYDADVIATVGHDSAAAVAGIPGFGENKLYISVGTNISMGVEQKESLVTDEAYEGGFKNTGGIGRSKILYRDFSAFWILNELRRNWSQEGKNYSYSDLIAAARKVKSKNVFIDVEEKIFNDAGGDMRIKINTFLKSSGQEEIETVGEFVLCVLESITLKVKYTAEFLRNRLNIPFKQVFVINGGSRNDLLMQMISDSLGTQVHAGLPYATITGNILTQMYALKAVSGIEEMRQLSEASFQLKVYEPDRSKNWDEILVTMIEKQICR